VSFYKMFGYPTGIGALVARRAALERLRRPWFSGGTIELVSVRGDRHLFKPAPEAFEDGTVDFGALSGLAGGFDLIERVGVSVIKTHVRRLTELLLRKLGELRHANGQPVGIVYGPAGMDARGGTVAFNVLDSEGTVLPFDLIEADARSARVSIRSGCFCNPGAAEHAFDLSADEMGACLAAAQLDGAFSHDLFARCMAPRPVGAVRMSVGLANNEADVLRGVAVIARWRDQNFTANAR
jgi:selenocysteine lyase/cysteine desulfurase